MNKCFVLLIFVTPYIAVAQSRSLEINNDSINILNNRIPAKDTSSLVSKTSYSATDSVFPHKKNFSSYTHPITQFILPVTLTGVGFIGLESDWLKYQNHEVRDELQENIDSKFTIDDFSQYLPMATVYGLNLCGIHGLHNFRDRTVILATSALVMGITVNSLKRVTHVERPDSSSCNSFPSGHTAMAFMGAEFLWQEYKDVSPWIGIAGFAVAAGTGFFRLYNNKHWLTDVMAGAGIGILSAKVGYMIFPFIERTLFRKNNKEKNIAAAPYFSKGEGGLCCVIRF